MNQTSIGILGGSGLYRLDELVGAVAHDIDTPFGKPSDHIVTGQLDGVAVAFLARHGQGHALLPSEVPYRANIHALKQLGVRYLLSFSAVGSLRQEIAPLDMVVPDQYLDLTRSRSSTFFGGGAVAQVSMAQPVCGRLGGLLAQAVQDATPEVNLHCGGTYVCMEGPQFSSLAESNGYRAMGADIVGMTNMPEAKLAREAQIAYASLAMVTDYDCWHPDEDDVSTSMALANLKKNAARARQILIRSIQLVDEARPASSAHDALADALVTPLKAMPEDRQALVRLLLQ